MRSEVLRWTACAAIVAAAHGAAWLELTRADIRPQTDAGAPVVELNLTAIAAPPPSEPQSQPEASQAPEAAQSSPPPMPEPSPSEALASPEPIPPPPTEEPRPPAPEPTPVASDPPTPPAPQPPAEPPAPPADAAASTEADRLETSPAAVVVAGREEASDEAAIKTWQRNLIAQIERHKRFPANAKGRFGVVDVAFRIDRKGRLVEAHVLNSSGFEELDEAALDLIRRAQPFVPPPPALRESELSFVAPIRYMRAGKI